MKTRRRTAVCGILLLGCAAQVQACLNDTEVRQAEAEFRSRYERPEEKPATWRTVFGINTLGVVGLVGGLGVIGLVSVTVAKRKR